jgi:hypothetical protein
MRRELRAAEAEPAASQPRSLADQSAKENPDA